MGSWRAAVDSLYRCGDTVMATLCLLVVVLSVNLAVQAHTAFPAGGSGMLVDIPSAANVTELHHSHTAEHR